jgi:hypothetical protein
MAQVTGQMGASLQLCILRLVYKRGHNFDDLRTLRDDGSAD